MTHGFTGESKGLTVKRGVEGHGVSVDHSGIHVQPSLLDGRGLIFMQLLTIPFTLFADTS